jgi:hypothetical protein
MFIAFQCEMLAKEINYPVSAIPDSLKNNAKIVVRKWDQTFEIKSIGKAVETVTYAITILNENGQEYAAFRKGYSQKLSRIHSIKGTIYNAEGEKVESLVQDKIVDYSAISGYSLFEDSRIKYFEPKTMTYPFTVEYSYVEEFDGLLYYPEWQPADDYNMSIESSMFLVICPVNLAIRYLEKNLIEKAVINKSETVTTYQWKIKNMVAYVEEPYSGSFEEFCPTVIPVPNEIEMDGYKGNLTTWNEFGKWTMALAEGRTELPEATKAMLIEKVKSCSTDYEKAKLVYEYMQGKTRYLNISIGIGGWQPIPAETVDRLGYGDCKALSNYTKSLLEAVGVKAYYTRILAGKYIEPLDKSFPYNNFNHIILCLPLSKDTLWLECTNQHFPFGFIGSFTDDREALVITDDGGEILHTRIYTKNENWIHRNCSIKLEEDGFASLAIYSKYNGIYYESVISNYLAGTEDKKRMIMDDLDIPGVVLNKFNYEEIRGEVPSILEDLQIDVPRFATISGQRMIVTLIPVDRLREIPKKVSNRKSDVIIQREMCSTDTIKIDIPGDFTVESLPSEININSEFGRYNLICKAQNNQIICIRYQEIKKGRYSADKYINLIEFSKKIAAADNSKASLKKTQI